MAYTSGLIGAYIFGELNAPTTQIFEWDVRELSSPVGTRTIAGGHPAFVKELGVTIPKAMQFEDVVIDYGNDALSGIYQSRVQAFTIGLANNDFSISNMRFWMPSGTALNSSGYMEFAASGTWIPNALLPSGEGTEVSTTLPTLQNVIRQDDVFGNLDFADDTHVSQFVYLSLAVTSGMPLGQYGLNSNGDLAFRVTYDWYYKFNSSGSMT